MTGMLLGTVVVVEDDDGIINDDNDDDDDDDTAAVNDDRNEMIVGNRSNNLIIQKVYQPQRLYSPIYDAPIGPKAAECVECVLLLML
jgi:hypothetical protein